MDAKKVVRIKARRKVSIALRETLKASGWDEDGKASIGSARRSLRGSLELYPFQPAVLASQDDLKRDMKILLNYIERQQAWNEPIQDPIQSLRNIEDKVSGPTYHRSGYASL